MEILDGNEQKLFTLTINNITGSVVMCKEEERLNRHETGSHLAQNTTPKLPQADDIRSE